MYGLLPVNNDNTYSLIVSHLFRNKLDKTDLDGSGDISTHILKPSVNYRGDLNHHNYTDFSIEESYRHIVDQYKLTLDNTSGSYIDEDSGMLTIDGIDAIMPGATEKGMLSTDGEYFETTMVYSVGVCNDNCSSTKTANIDLDPVRFVHTTNRNIKDYVIQGPVADDSGTKMKFYIDNNHDIMNVYVGLLNSD